MSKRTNVILEHIEKASENLRQDVKDLRREIETSKAKSNIKLDSDVAFALVRSMMDNLNVYGVARQVVWACENRHVWQVNDHKPTRLDMIRIVRTITNCELQEALKVVDSVLDNPSNRNDSFGKRRDDCGN